MLVYVLICLSLSLAGVAGLQFFYMFYLDRVDKEQKKRLRILEQKCRLLKTELEKARSQVSEHEEFIKTIYEELGEDEEIWADVIEESKS